jgi:hypothetical protein
MLTQAEAAARAEGEARVRADKAALNSAQACVQMVRILLGTSVLVVRGNACLVPVSIPGYRDHQPTHCIFIQTEAAARAEAAARVHAEKAASEAAARAEASTQAEAARVQLVRISCSSADHA